MSAKPYKFIAATGLCILSVFGQTGCGGGQGAGQGANQTRNGQVRLNISWPAKSAAPPTSRYIPGYAASLFFELYPKGNPNQRYQLTANRPSDKPTTQQVTFHELLPAGTYELAGAARALPDAQGATVASGAMEIEVKSGMNAVGLTLNSTVRTLLVLGTPINVGIGQDFTLQSGAFDPDGQGLLLPDGALVWSIKTGSQFGAITPGGKLTATAAGTIRVHVEEPVTKVFAEADVTVSTTTTNIGLAASGYPKAGADLGGTGLVQGSGATGIVAWHFDLGTRAVGTPVLGNNNTLFAMNQNGVVFAFNAADGTKLWQATIPNVGNGLINASLVVSDDNTVYAGTAVGVAAFDAATGLQKWLNTDFNCQAALSLFAGKLYVPTSAQGMAIIDARTGATILPGLPAINNDQTYTYDGAIYNGVIYYISESFPLNRAAKLFAINLTTRAVVWSKDIPNHSGSGYSGSYPIVSSTGTLYFSPYGLFNDNDLLALDATTGATIATLPGSYGSREPGIGQDGSVYFNHTDPVTFITGTAKYNSTLTNQAWKSPPQLMRPSVGTDGTVYGTGPDKADDQGYDALYALNGTDGTVKWKVPLRSGVFTSHVPGATCVAPNGWIYVSATDQQLYAIK
jgi:outer membrane protein assembly factor BamB